jgi:hypothetical protein
MNATDAGGRLKYSSPSRPVNSTCETPRRGRTIEDADVGRLQRVRLRVCRGERPGDEDASLMNDRHRRRAIRAGDCKHHAPIEDKGVHVKDVTRNELLEHVIRAGIPQRMDDVPQFMV